MNSRDFCYWLQGFLEISLADDPESRLPLSEAQVSMIKRHLHMVFAHEIDPSFGTAVMALQEIHDAPAPESDESDPLKPTFDDAKAERIREKIAKERGAGERDIFSINPGEPGRIMC